MPDAPAPANTITSLEALEALYGTPSERAITKEIDYIAPEYAAFIEASPFVVLSTVAPEGTDSSPEAIRQVSCVCRTRRPFFCLTVTAITAQIAYATLFGTTRVAAVPGPGRW